MTMQANPNIAAMFDGMDKAPMMAGGQYMKGEGKFLVKSKGLKVQTGFKGTFLIFEFEIESAAPTNEVGPDGKPLDPVGSTRSKVISLDPKNQYKWSDSKAIAFALLGIDPRTMNDPTKDPEAHKQAMDLVKGAVSGDAATLAAIVDQRLVLETVKKQTRPTQQNPQGGLFTVHNWSPYQSG